MVYCWYSEIFLEIFRFLEDYLAREWYSSYIYFAGKLLVDFVDIKDILFATG
jgi:hypothetical protein